MSAFVFQLASTLAVLLVVRLFSAWLSILLVLPGTFLHEASHWIMGMVTGARPVGFSLVPRRTSARRWRLGSVKFMHLTPWNRPLVGLSPLLLLPSVWHLSEWGVRRSEASEWRAGFVYLVAVTLLSAWPSMEDWKLILKDSRWYLFPVFGFSLGLIYCLR